MAKRYGIKPSDFIKDDLEMYQLNLLVASTGVELEVKQHEKAMKKGPRGRR